MLLKDLLEYEFLPKDDAVASKLGQQLFNVASQEAYKARKPTDKQFIKQKAEALLNRFTSGVLKSIDSELMFLNDKEV